MIFIEKPPPFKASKVYYIMERVGTLLKKLQEQFEQKAPPDLLLLTVKMLQAELLQLQHGHTTDTGNPVAITLSQNTLSPSPGASGNTDAANNSETKIIEVLQVDEAAIEAELEEIRHNAEIMTKISVHNKPRILFEGDEEIPTLAFQRQHKTESPSKAINESVPTLHSSLNEKLKQTKIELGDALIETPVRDLKKAIGVNDRFLFINELFRGDEVMYERSIKTINGFSILPEAEYWIERELKVKNGWKDSEEVVKQFYQLVKRRFS